MRQIVVYHPVTANAMSSSGKHPVSVIILTKDEAGNIGQCIESVKWASEIIVYDSGSTDGTEGIARSMGATVIRDTEWRGYGVQRQKAQAKAKFEWILMLDADERVSESSAEEIGKAIGDSAAGVFFIPRLSWCFGDFIRRGGWYPDYVARLYRESGAAWDDALVHEKLIVKESVSTKKLNHPLHHYTYRDVQHYLSKSAVYAGAWAESKYSKGRRATLAAAVLHAIWAALRMYVFRLGFMDGRQGLLLSLLSSYSVFAKYAQLWELCRVRQSEEPEKQ